jgi:DNA-binding transcriptional ArsR family regulator
VIEFRLTANALGNTRFGYSPLGEVACSLRVLGAGPPGAYALRPWIREVTNALQTVDMELLRAVVPPGHFAPEFMFAWSTDPAITIENQLESLAATAWDEVHHDIQQVWRDRPPPRCLTDACRDTDSGCRRLADVIWDYWQVAIAPYWSRMRAAIEDDVSYRVRLVLESGMFGLLSDLHPEVTLRDDTLLIDKPHHADATYPDGDLTLLPSVFVWPNLILGHETPARFELMYAARGIGRVWEGLASGASTSSDPLGALIGRTRARILRCVDLPMTTTHLARALDQSPGSVSAHLSVLRANGLLSARRSGRSVLYGRTELGSSIVAVSPTPEKTDAADRDTAG